MMEFSEDFLNQDEDLNPNELASIKVVNAAVDGLMHLDAFAEDCRKRVFELIEKTDDLTCQKVKLKIENFLVLLSLTEKRSDEFVSRIEKLTN